MLIKKHSGYGYLVLLLLLLSLGSSLPMASASQSRIYRCGNEYTNLPRRAHTPPCVLLTQSFFADPRATQTDTARAKAPNGFKQALGKADSSLRIAPQLQQQRDSQARQVLIEERQKTWVRLAQVNKEWNQGHPLPLPSEVGNLVAYQARVSSLNSEIARLQGDLQSIDQELARLH